MIDMGWLGNVWHMVGQLLVNGQLGPSYGSAFVRPSYSMESQFPLQTWNSQTSSHFA